MTRTGFRFRHFAILGALLAPAAAHAQDSGSVVEVNSPSTDVVAVDAAVADVAPATDVAAAAAGAKSAQHTAYRVMPVSIGSAKPGSAAAMRERVMLEAFESAVRAGASARGISLVETDRSQKVQRELQQCSDDSCRLQSAKRVHATHLVQATVEGGMLKVALVDDSNNPAHNYALGLIDLAEPERIASAVDALLENVRPMAVAMADNLSAQAAAKRASGAADEACALYAEASATGLVREEAVDLSLESMTCLPPDLRAEAMARLLGDAVTANVEGTISRDAVFKVVRSYEKLVTHEVHQIHEQTSDPAVPIAQAERTRLQHVAAEMLAQLSEALQGALIVDEAAIAAIAEPISVQAAEFYAAEGALGRALELCDQAIAMTTYFDAKDAANSRAFEVRAQVAWMRVDQVVQALNLPTSGVGEAALPLPVAVEEATKTTDVLWRKQRHVGDPWVLRACNQLIALGHIEAARVRLEALAESTQLDSKASAMLANQVLVQIGSARQSQPTPEQLQARKENWYTAAHNHHALGQPKLRDDAIGEYAALVMPQLNSGNIDRAAALELIQVARVLSLKGDAMATGLCKRAAEIALDLGDAELQKAADQCPVPPETGPPTS